MMNQPLVTIALAVYNTEDYLRKCLESIRNQTYRNLEILCVNDGSTDSSLSILEEYAAEDPRVRIISQPNGGLASVRNASIHAASGKYLQMLDSDDFFEADMVQQMVDRAEEQDADIVVCACMEEHAATGRRECNVQTNMQLARQKLNLLCSCPAQDAPCDFFQIFNWAIVWDKLFKLEFIRKHHLIFQGHHPAEDIPFTYPALILARKVSLIDTVFIHYLVRPFSLSRQQSRNIAPTVQSFAMLWDFMLKHHASPELQSSFLLHAPVDMLCNIRNNNGVQPSDVVSYINKVRSMFPFFNGNHFSSTYRNGMLSCYEALFCPEITLILPHLSSRHQASLLRSLQSCINPLTSNLAIRILYANESGKPLPFELLDYPVAMPVQVPHGATAEERIATCRALPLPPPALEIWPGCDPAPLQSLIRQHKRQLRLSRMRRIFALTAGKREKFKSQTRILRAQLRSLKHMLNIIHA